MTPLPLQCGCHVWTLPYNAFGQDRQRIALRGRAINLKVHKHEGDGRGGGVNYLSPESSCLTVSGPFQRYCDPPKGEIMRLCGTNFAGGAVCHFCSLEVGVATPSAAAAAYTCKFPIVPALLTAVGDIRKQGKIKLVLPRRDGEILRRRLFTLPTLLGLTR